jgi:hypothetical protein
LRGPGEKRQKDEHEHEHDFGEERRGIPASLCLEARAVREGRVRFRPNRGIPRRPAF